MFSSGFFELKKNLLFCVEIPKFRGLIPVVLIEIPAVFHPQKMGFFSLHKISNPEKSTWNFWRILLDLLFNLGGKKTQNYGIPRGEEKVNLLVIPGKNTTLVFLWISQLVFSNPWEFWECGASVFYGKLRFFWCWGALGIHIYWILLGKMGSK